MSKQYHEDPEPGSYVKASAGRWLGSLSRRGYFAGRTDSEWIVLYSRRGTPDYGWYVVPPDWRMSLRRIPQESA